MANKEEGLARYNLSLPTPLYEELLRVAGEQHTTVLELLRRFIKLGLVVTDIEGKGGVLRVREADGNEYRLLVL